MRLAGANMRNVYSVLIILTAVFGFGLGAAFAGGAMYGRRTAKVVAAPVATTAPGAAAAAFGGGGGGAGGAGAGGSASATAQAGGGAGAAQGQGGVAARGGGGATVGTVESVSASTLTVKTPAGATATITLAADTEVRQTVAAQRTDLKAGQNVTVAGTAGADGNVQARTITIAPAAAGR